MLDGPPSNPALKFSTQRPSGVYSPDKVETRLGTLKFTDGFPDKDTARTLLDNLDFQRAVQAYLLALPAVNQVGNRNAILSLGPVNATVPIWEEMVDARTVELTANDNTPYTWFWIDLRKGPLVIEVPPKVLGLVNDLWYRWVSDVGITGPDHGQGGKFLAAASRLHGRGAGRLPRRAARHVQQPRDLAQLRRGRQPQAGRRRGEGRDHEIYPLGPGGEPPRRRPSSTCRASRSTW